MDSCTLLQRLRQVHAGGPCSMEKVTSWAAHCLTPALEAGCPMQHIPGDVALEVPSTPEHCSHSMAAH